MLCSFLLLLHSPFIAEASEVDQAEYRRLSSEMEKLAARNAWAGVERMYENCLSTGYELSFENHMTGAHAARALGDVTSARARLMRAHRIREERQIVDWLWEIDSNYGRVFLAADAGKVELRVHEMPFNPDQAKGVEFARAQVDLLGLFDGYLPAGKYTFGENDISVVPRVESIRIDLRSDRGADKYERKAKKIKAQSDG